MLKPAEEESSSLELQAARVHEELLVFHADSELFFWSVLMRQVAGNIVLWPTSTRCSGGPWRIAISGQAATRHIVKPSPSQSSVRNRKLVVADHWLCLCIPLFQRFFCRTLDRRVLGLSAPSQHIKPLRRRS